MTKKTLKILWAGAPGDKELEQAWDRLAQLHTEDLKTFTVYGLKSNADPLNLASALKEAKKYKCDMIAFPSNIPITPEFLEKATAAGCTVIREVIYREPEHTICQHIKSGKVICMYGKTVRWRKLTRISVRETANSIFYREEGEMIENLARRASAGDNDTMLPAT